jgi:hypothetical protein
MADLNFQVEDLPEEFKPFGHLRIGFIRKVYGILSFQLSFTLLFSIFAMMIPSLATFLQQSSGLLILASVLSIAILIPLLCCKEFARQVPTNYILLSIFTICEAYMVATTCSIYDPMTVVIAASMTLGVTLVLTAYAYTTQHDFRVPSAIGIVLLSSLILFVVFAGIFGLGGAFEVVWCTLGVITYGMYLVIDTQMIADGSKHGLTVDDYIIGALMLYVDIIGLFLYLLRLLENVRRN